MQTRITSVNRDVVWMFFAAVVLVLLIACTNVAGLVLARSVSRQKAVALRAALGGSRWRMLGELAMESILLSLWGGCVGIVIAYFLTPLLRAQSFDAVEKLGLEDARDLRFEQ